MKRKVLTGILSALSLAWVYMGYLGWTWIPIGKRPHKGQVRVACVGDSITYGAMIKNWYRHNYPRQLGEMLGKQYVVHNYGLSSSTGMKTGDFPYVKTPRYKRSLHFNPDIVLLKFGTNDSKAGNWRGKTEFKEQYEELLNSYLNLKSQPKVYLLTPAAPHPVKGNAEGEYSFGIRKPEILEEIDVIYELSKLYQLPVIDIYKLTENHPEFFVKDGIHPNAEGALQIARKIVEVLCCE